MTNKDIVFCGKFGIIINFILGFTKVILGIIFNSISMMIEAVNNIIDMFSSILLLIGIKKSINEKNISFVISFFMIITSCIFVDESIDKIINPCKLIFDKYFYIILVITFIIKIFQYNVYKNIYQKNKRSSIRVITIETKNDIVNSFSIALSLIIMSYFSINVDGFIGLIASLYILYNSVKTLNEI